MRLRARTPGEDLTVWFGKGRAAGHKEEGTAASCIASIHEGGHPAFLPPKKRHPGHGVRGSRNPEGIAPPLICSDFTHSSTTDPLSFSGEVFFVLWFLLINLNGGLLALSTVMCSHFIGTCRSVRRVKAREGRKEGRKGWLVHKVLIRRQGDEGNYTHIQIVSEGSRQSLSFFLSLVSRQGAFGETPPRSTPRLSARFTARCHALVHTPCKLRFAPTRRLAGRNLLCG